MLPPEIRNKIRESWLPAFEDLRRLKEDAIPKHYTFRQMAGLYAVASICYEYGNGEPIIPDAAFDRLCDSINKHFEECVQAGANKLDRELVKNHSGYKTGTFVKPYHEIAEVLLGHPCQCIECRQMSLSKSAPDFLSR